MRGFGGMGNMGGLMAQAQKMQAKLAKVQEEIAAIEIDGEAGSGGPQQRQAPVRSQFDRSVGH